MQFDSDNPYIVADSDLCVPGQFVVGCGYDAKRVHCIWVNDFGTGCCKSHHLLVVGIFSQIELVNSVIHQVPFFIDIDCLTHH